MALDLKSYTISIASGGTMLKFPTKQSSKKYTSSIGPIVGITETKADDDFNGIGSLNGLQEAGAVITISVGYKDGDTLKRTNLLCVSDKFTQARGQLLKQQIFGKNIVSVGLPGRRSFR